MMTWPVSQPVRAGKGPNPFKAGWGKQFKEWMEEWMDCWMDG